MTRLLQGRQDLPQRCCNVTCVIIFLICLFTHPAVTQQHHHDIESHVWSSGGSFSSLFGLHHLLRALQLLNAPHGSIVYSGFLDVFQEKKEASSSYAFHTAKIKQNKKSCICLAGFVP